MKMLPESITDEMIDGFNSAFVENDQLYKEEIIAGYKAMYAAAPNVECEPVAWVISADNDIQIHTLDWESQIVQDLPIGTELYTIPQDQSKRIAELEAKNAKLIEALEAAHISVNRLTSDESSIQEDFDNEDLISCVLAEMKKGE